MALDFVLAFVGFVTGITAGFFGIGGGGGVAIWAGLKRRI
ncbi:hypothetical protein BN341_13100 [Helicobacter heilmannii ASB1.4]|nr:hypothetical protein BN341_13100 [Helicobacter heilmannii ASB1.4]